MANHPSAQKRHRQSIKRRTRNRQTKSRIRSLEKKVRALASQAHRGTNAKDAIAVEALPGLLVSSLKEAETALAKAATKGILHRRTAARHISRVAKAAARAQAAL